MKILSIEGSTGNSEIIVNTPFIIAKELLEDERTFIITDTNVRALYEKDFPPGEIITIGTGEKIKTLRTVEQIYKKLVELEADRSSFILGIGGGIVCDIAGFAASTYMRGVRFGFIASTLLAQADAAIGGKNGVNFEGYKNMIGIFKQPEFVICDPAMLRTLPERELKTGFAEIIKHALISSSELFEYLVKNNKKALDLNPEIIEDLVYHSVSIKSEIVNRDESEKGERRKLNFGHTIAHALEKTTELTHGEAVAAGIGISSKLSMKYSNLSAGDETKIHELLKQFDLNRKISFSCSDVKKAIRKDKKREKEIIYCIMLKKIGESIIKEIPITVMEGIIDDMY